jgi:hypothetical protein
MIVYVAHKPDAMDKVNAAIAELDKTIPLGGPAFEAATDSSAHRDEVFRSTVVFK